jgi:RNA polymerase sigma factor (sigma-70 family)
MAVNSVRGIVLFGDVIASRLDPLTATAWLRTLAAELEHTYRGASLARFAFTQGDEIQGLLRADADPYLAVLRAALHEASQPMRWAISLGSIDPGRGPAIERTGPAFLAARAAITSAEAARDGLVVSAGDERTDALLADLAPLFAELLGELTPRQQEIARLLLVDGLRQSEVAARLGVTRATVSVVANRGRIRSIRRLHHALGILTLGEAVAVSSVPA